MGTTERETERQRDRETERQRDRETDRQIDRQTDRQTDRQRQVSLPYREVAKWLALSSRYSGW
eukprot:COSAG03_NODE_7176_length_953_cov_24.498829_2_plen_63_part_00